MDAISPYVPFIILAVVIALIFGLGCQYIFTEVLIIDLPSGGG